MAGSSPHLSLESRGAAARLGLLVACAVGAVGCARSAAVRYPGLPSLPDGALHIVNFDLGQADAVLVLYGGKSLLIDAGVPRQGAQRAVRRISRRLEALTGSRHLDFFLTSHYHRDHLGAPQPSGRRGRPSGIFALIDLASVTVDTIVDRGDWTLGARGSSHERYLAAVQRWIASGVVRHRRSVRAGDRIDLGPGLHIEVVVAAANGYLDQIRALNPALFEEFPPSENDYAVGLKLTLGPFEMLVAGDLNGQNVLRRFGPHTESGSDLESRIAARVGALEVYRVNHHGSAHSTNACFAQVLRPMVSVFSTGDNSYGHPSLDVYERLKQHGDVYITAGAASDALPVVAADIVGDDVEVLVAPGGERFWVNGQPYRSLTDAEEAARPGSLAECPVAALPQASEYRSPHPNDDEPD